MPTSIKLRIRRQDRPDSAPYWQDFAIPYQPDYNVLSILMVLRENPVTTDGRRVDPVTWEHNCMEEVCGACAMLINGRPDASNASEQPSALPGSAISLSGPSPPASPPSSFPPTRSAAARRPSLQASAIRSRSS